MLLILFGLPPPSDLGNVLASEEAEALRVPLDLKLDVPDFGAQVRNLLVLTLLRLEGLKFRLLFVYQSLEELLVLGGQEG